LTAKILVQLLLSPDARAREFFSQQGRYDGRLSDRSCSARISRVEPEAVFNYPWLFFEENDRDRDRRDDYPERRTDHKRARNGGRGRDDDHQYDDPRR
jgi:hypothetical protein